MVMLGKNPSTAPKGVIRASSNMLNKPAVPKRAKPTSNPTKSMMSETRGNGETKKSMPSQMTENQSFQSVKSFIT